MPLFPIALRTAFRRPDTACAPAGGEGAVPARGGPAWVTWGLAGLLFTVYAAVSVRRHQRMLTTGFDLGIFEQVVRSYAHGHLPVVELKGPGYPELGDHFSPVLATLAPFYRLWPSPLVLLLAQAALLAVAVVPLTGWARRELGDRAAWIVGLGYGASWGIASAVGFDFHEVCFAVPLLALSLAALGRNRLVPAAAWALPLLLVKEDLGLTVAVIGVLIARRGGRRLGPATAVAGVAGTVLEVLVVIPALSAAGHYDYWEKLPASTGSTASGLPALLYRGTIGLVAMPEPKAVTLILLFAPTAFVALRSPLAWTVVPTLAWRFASDNPLYWGTGFQYSAVLMPIVFAACLDGLTRRPAVAPRDRRCHLIVTAAVTAVLLPQFPLFQLALPGTWRTPARVAAAHRIMRLIPDGATVAASNHLAPQLAARTTVSEFGMNGSRPDPQWIIMDTTTSRGWPLSGVEQGRLLPRVRAQGYRVAADADGYLLLRRTASAAP
ncbi:DUF2079 domain-containing protein [Streptomyces sp. NPDC053079]|uniref:DUF2079 domain-containing protein n=1 Tax=Streptomyces sp. NPDC053079 TaxID=3365697 RepID=UPI0037D7BA72